VVNQLHLMPFYRQHRDDGHGHPTDDSKLLLGVLLHGYCIGVRSSQRDDQQYGQALGDKLPQALASKA
jgi:hypothetical protein